MTLLQTQIQLPLVWPPAHPSSRIGFPFQFASARTVVVAPLPIVPAPDTAIPVHCSVCIFLQRHEAVRNRNIKLEFRNPCHLHYPPAGIKHR